MDKYDHKKIEKKWQEYWEKEKVFEVKEDETKGKFYGLVEFPYPSGDGLHTGHLRSNTAMDIICRKKRMEGFNVLYPYGWDAFGLPAENYAIKQGIKPQIVTKQNIATFTRQCKESGFSFDWSRSFSTTDPDYYKWTQWIFIQMFKNGLAYKAKENINWCTSCKIGLANEEVVNGVCERCGGEVVKKEKEQWILKITKYADRLIEDLDQVDYLERIKTQQINWIGRSEGVLVKFPISSFQFPNKSQIINSKTQEYYLEVFTTRPDTLFGVTFMVVAPEHPLVSKYKNQLTNNKEIEEYVNNAKKKNELERTDLNKDKTGVELKGLKAINPVNNEEIPIYVADYVMMGYGTGAIMAVPAHDERDFGFAKKYNIRVREVVMPVFGEPNKQAESRKTISAVVRRKSDSRFLLVKWKKHNWIAPVVGGVDKDETLEQAVEREVLEEVGYKAKAVKRLGSMIESHFFADNKNVWRHRVDQPILLELVDEKQRPVELDREEQERHEAIWLTKEEALKQITHQDNKIGLLRFFEEYVYTGEGIAVNSGEFNGLITQRFKEKITQWLEDKGLGEKDVNYKLHDWIFSRQRYWGEPIPMVYCEECAKKKPSVLLIHGTGARRGAKNWFPWLKTALESMGYQVFDPDLPNPDKPDLDTWLGELEKYKRHLNEDSIIVGHSLGCPTALHLIQSLDFKIKKLICVAPTHRNMDWEKSIKEHPDAPYEYIKRVSTAAVDYKKVDKNVNYITCYFSTDDPHIPLYVSEEFEKDLPQVKNIVLKNRRHFSLGSKSINAERFSELLDEFERVENTGWIPVPDKDLPVKLPNVDDFMPTEEGDSPLAKAEDWVKTKCPKCGGEVRRETDVMPNWAGSNWYFIRYCDSKNDRQIVDREKAIYWLPVDWYNGGMEHTTLHLLYSRFVYKFLYDIGAVPKECGPEPYAKRTAHGMVLAEGGVKMSKSKGNVINPDEYIEKYGADTMRVYEMFMGPFEQAIAWDVKGVVGVRRFLEKVWGLGTRIDKRINANEFANKKLDRLTHQTIKKVTEDIEHMRFNTAISQMMILVNEMEKQDKILITHYSLLITLLSPFAPHICEEIWSRLRTKSSESPAGDSDGTVSDSIIYQKWPEYNPELIKEDEIELVIQVNGKVRDKIMVAADIAEGEAKEKALASEKVKKWLEGKELKKVIFVPEKLVNVVI